MIETGLDNGEGLFDDQPNDDGTDLLVGRRFEEDHWTGWLMVTSGILLGT